MICFPCARTRMAGPAVCRKRRQAMKDCSGCKALNQDPKPAVAAAARTLAQEALRLDKGGNDGSL